MDDILRIFIGYDQREDEAYRICQASILRRTSSPVHIVPIKLHWMHQLGLCNRPWTMDGAGKRVDARDGRPFSTDFAFSRFLVPQLAKREGWALFVDCDFLFVSDVAELFAQADDRYAVMVVKHDHRPPETIKMDGQPQQHYRRKNWSSLILWNCGHPSNAALTNEEVSNKPGSWLHGFEWLKDEEIGDLSTEWNWLEGWSNPAIKPKAIHYTRGGPWWDAYKDVGHADKWLNERRVVDESEVLVAGTEKSYGNAFGQRILRPPPKRDAAE